MFFQLFSRKKRKKNSDIRNKTPSFFDPRAADDFVGSDVAVAGVWIEKIVFVDVKMCAGLGRVGLCGLKDVGERDASARSFWAKRGSFEAQEAMGKGFG